MGIQYDLVDPPSLPAMSKLFSALMNQDSIVRERFPLWYWEPDHRARAVEPELRSATPELWDRMARDNRRLGASTESLKVLDSIRIGRGVFVITGQQPGLFGGPLYTLYKVATAVDLARWMREELAIPTAPLLWNASDDVDFSEVATAVFPGTDLTTAALTLEASAHEEGRWVGDIGGDALEGVHERLASLFDEAPSVRWTMERIDAARERAGDFGEFFSALYLELFRDQGLLVLDARWPEIRRASGGLFATYVQKANVVHGGVRDAGEALARLGFERPLRDAQSRFGLMVVEGGRRLDVRREDREREALSRLEARPETVSPSVLLRPLVEDSLLPAAAVVLGPGEVAYWAQLREAYEALDVRMPVVWPRLTATLVPGEVEDALGDHRPGDILKHLEALIRDRERDGLPPEIRDDLDELGRTLAECLEGLRIPLKELDRGLVDVLDSAGRKIDFQVRRIGEQAVSKLRGRSPQIALVGRVRNLLYPKGRLQERSLSSLWPFFRSGSMFVEDLLSMSGLHRERLLRKRGAHLAVRLSRGQ